MTLILLVEQIFNGVQYGLMLFLMAVGVTLVFGIMRVINLAHGSLFMIGGYLLMQSLAWTSSYALAVPLAFIAIGAGCDRARSHRAAPALSPRPARSGACDLRADAVLQRGRHRDLGPRGHSADDTAAAVGLQWRSFRALSTRSIGW